MTKNYQRKKQTSIPQKILMQVNDHIVENWGIWHPSKFELVGLNFAWFYWLIIRSQGPQQTPATDAGVARNNWTEI